MSSELKVIADHFQFLIGDSTVGITVDTTQLWQSRGIVGVMADVPEIVGIGTIRSCGWTRVVVTVGDALASERPAGRTLGQFVLHLPSGIALLWGPNAVDLSSAPRVRVMPGTYRGTVVLHGDEGVDELAEEGPEEYRILLEGPLESPDRE
jgi:hypothetical protein